MSSLCVASLAPHEIFHEMLQGFGPTTHMVVSRRGALEDRLMQGQLGSAPLVREGYRNYRLMERSTGIIFESIRKNEPLRLHDLLIYASLSLYDPGVVTRGDVSAAMPRL